MVIQGFLHNFRVENTLFLDVAAAEQIVTHIAKFFANPHTNRRAKARTGSTLDVISGIGPRRRQALLRQFGGVKQVAQAGVEDLSQVEGISAELAQRIYDAFHGGG